MKPREIRRLPEAEAIRHWEELYVKGGYRVLGASQYLGQDDTWIEVEIPHDRYAADWNDAAITLAPWQIDRASEYARRSSQLPPGMANFNGRSLVVTDGNHRAHAAYLRGDPTARFYMPLCDWERFLVAIDD
jgi:hypothetical protein